MVCNNPMLGKYMFSLFKKTVKPTNELLCGKLFNGEIDNILGNALIDIGFDKIKENKWVKDLGAGSRQIVTIAHWKGATSSPSWGYSLDYVPHFDNLRKHIYWHRTNKSALIDVFPLFFDFQKYSFERFTSHKNHIKALKVALPEIIRDIELFYSRGSGLDELISILERSKAHDGRGLGFWNYLQLPLAYAFVLNKCGQYESARLLLLKWIDMYDIKPELIDKLWKRFQLASA